MYKTKPSKNAVTIDVLKVACRHVAELITVGATENIAIRTVELLADVYAKLYFGGSATPHHVGQVKLWSVAALTCRQGTPSAKPKDYLRVEHGTPRRAFARMVLKQFRNEELNETSMNDLCDSYWKLAVITLEEDRQLNKLARSKMFRSPMERWAAAGISFPDCNQ